MDIVIRHLRRAVVRLDGAGWSDGQLLASFIDRKDEAAFEALVRRHGRMVFGVCRRVVGHHHDAEDAFQATFLVLARKASCIRPRERLANWLYGVALRTAMKTKTITAKRSGREKRVTEMAQAAPQDQWCDLQPLLDQELNGLPENYRLPILLCDLEGKTIKEATRQLGWPQGTLAGRLARGRKLLAKRLTNRGVVLSAGSLAAVVSQNAAWAVVPTSLLCSTIKAAAMIAAGQATAAGVVPAQVAILTEGVLRAMFLSKLKATMAGLLLIALFCGTAGTIYVTQAAEQPKDQKVSEKADKEKQPIAAKKEEKPKPDKERLQGTWKIVSVVDNGEKCESQVGEVCEEWTFEDSTVKVMRPATKNAVASTSYVRFRLDQTMNPKEIDIVEGKADNLFETAKFDKRLNDLDERIEGIYSIAGDSLKICISRHMSERPNAFESKKGSTYILWTLQRQRPKDQEKKGEQTRGVGQANKTVRESTPQEVRPPEAADQREYVIMSRLMEAAAGQPKEVFGLPKATVDDGQLVPIYITDPPQNLLEKVVLDEQIKIGTFFDVRVSRLRGNKIRLFVSFQRNEVEKSSVSEIRVLGNNVQVIQVVELRKPVKIALQKDGKGSAQRWVEVTVDEQIAPAVPPRR
jgi:RNA polymerase sigma factor (sigma-70 family)